MRRACASGVTCADDFGVGASVGVARLACADDSIGRGVVGADRIRITSTVLHQTTICTARKTVECMSSGRRERGR